MCVSMCVGVFKCSDVMVSCYEQFRINKTLVKTKTSVLYNKRVASKHKTKNMFVKPTLAEHKKHIHILSLRWLNFGLTLAQKKTHTAHKKLTLAQHCANVGSTQNQCWPNIGWPNVGL